MCKTMASGGFKRRANSPSSDNAAMSMETSDSLGVLIRKVHGMLRRAEKLSWMFVDQGESKGSLVIQRLDGPFAVI